MAGGQPVADPILKALDLFAQLTNTRVVLRSLPAQTPTNFDGKNRVESPSFGVGGENLFGMEVGPDYSPRSINIQHPRQNPCLDFLYRMLPDQGLMIPKCRLHNLFNPVKGLPSAGHAITINAKKKEISLLVALNNLLNSICVECLINPMKRDDSIGFDSAFAATSRIQHFMQDWLDHRWVKQMVFADDDQSKAHPPTFSEG